jgi:serine/threonine-protein kinase
MTLPERFGRFQVRGVLGTGATAIVYDGYDASLQRSVAIKTLREELLQADDAQEMLERFRREARISAQLRHEHLILVYEFNEEWNPPFIAMERIEAPSLAEHVKSGQQFSEQEAVEVVNQLLSALGYIHERGYVHRDIKPSNLFWGGGQGLKLADFGIAQIRSSTLTRIGSEVGTPAYMSPEQFLGDKVDSRSDLWSCGVILYELLTGQRLFSGAYDTVRESVLGTNDRRAPAGASVAVPQAFAQVVKRALARDPAQRFRDAAEFQRALRQAGQCSGAEDDQNLTRVRRSGEPKRLARAPGSLRIRHPRVWGSALVVLIAAVIAFLLWPRNPDMDGIKRVISAYACANLDASLDGNLVRVSGFVPTETDAASLQMRLSQVHGVKQVVAQLQVRGRPYCELLEMLGPYTKSQVAQAAGMRLRIQNYGGRLTDGDAIVFDMASPGFPAYLYVDYFQLDGNVVHLYPPHKGQQRILPANSSRVLPDPHDPLQLEVRSPFGEEMVVMIASREPLPIVSDSQFQPAQEYLPVLNQALKTREKGSVAADYLFLITVRKGG